MKKSALVLCLLVVSILAGCGYHAPGAGDKWAGEGGRTLHVELFANSTTEPYLDTILSSEITAQMARSRLVELTGQRSAADLIIDGTITGFSSSALAYNARDDISEYQAQMTATARLLRRSDNTVLWQGTLSRSERYSSQSDKGLQRTGESLAARVAARRLAEDLMARLLEDF
ncbi:MAG: LPS assembly lipoprotein LptE [Desulfuromonadales bacterium]|nr:LPS assembly lipoprotein LptE [Desulfuromonadales bacterium]